MSLLAADGKEIGGDFIIGLTLRSDLAPIPKTLEATIRYDEDIAPLLAEGKTLTAGPDGDQYRIVKSLPTFSAEGQQGGRALASIAVSAYHEKTVTIGFRRAKAIIKEKTSLAQIYAAAGATVTVQDDISIEKFCCLVGQVPSFAVAKIIQEEGGAVYWTGRSMRFARIEDLAKQAPLYAVGPESVSTIESGFLERHQVPWFYSLDENGAFAFGNRERARAAIYSPRKNVRVLRNGSRCLILRNKLTSLYRPDIQAGAAIQVGAVNNVVITAAHVLEPGTDGSPTNTYSKFWLGEVDG